MCDAALFSTARVGERASSEPFLSILTHLPPHLAEEIKTVMVAKATKFLAVARRLDCSRLPLIPYADTLATMVKMDLLNIRSVIKSFYEMTLLETTRTAGITCLGKLVEVAFEKVRQCDAKSLETIRLALACAQQDDFFLYDVEYIAENLGWFQNKPTLALQVSGPHHGLPIVSLAYNAGGVSGREAVVTSSASGSVTTWSGRGEPLAIFRLSVHYASSLDISTNGQILFVGSTGRERKTPPAVVIYSHVDGEWKEHDGIEPKNEGFVTSVRAFKNSQNHKCCVSTSSLTNHSLQVYDINKRARFRSMSRMTSFHVCRCRVREIISSSQGLATGR
ncbi:G-protein (beta)-like protein [Angomonas deanei]|nr:G-protein (beta)-like protein [Angomonas deanei]|eukprot:EPY31993.1 G-protein (beta)-like protein [Angomonas deanei]